MLSASIASRLVVSGARRAVVVGGQCRAVQVIRRTSTVRGFQSIAQTDRVRHLLLFQRITSFHLFSLWVGYHYPFIVFYRDQTRS